MGMRRENVWIICQGETMRIKVTTESDFHIIAPLEDVDPKNALELETLLQKVIGEGHRKIILDFSRVNYIESSGLGAIVRAHRLIKDQNGMIILGGCNEGLRKVFSLINFQRFFKITDSLQEALKS